MIAPGQSKLRVGLISDTHGLLRPEAIAFLEGCDHIVHAGDVSNAAVVEALSTIAPLTVVRGNNDQGDWAQRLRGSETLRVGEIVIHVVHDLADLRIEPADESVQVVISGHSHKPKIEHRAGVLYVNPGSAGPHRFKLPVSAAELTIEGSRVSARIVDLLVAPRVPAAASKTTRRQKKKNPTGL